MKSSAKPGNSIFSSNHLSRNRNSNLLQCNRVNRKANRGVQTIMHRDCQGRIVQTVIVAKAISMGALIQHLDWQRILCHWMVLSSISKNQVGFY